MAHRADPEAAVAPAAGQAAALAVARARLRAELQAVPLEFLARVAQVPAPERVPGPALAEEYRQPRPVRWIPRSRRK